MLYLELYRSSLPLIFLYAYPLSSLLLGSIKTRHQVHEMADYNFTISNGPDYEIDHLSNLSFRSSKVGNHESSSSPFLRSIDTSRESMGKHLSIYDDVSNYANDESIHASLQRQHLEYEESLKSNKKSYLKFILMLVLIAFTFSAFLLIAYKNSMAYSDDKTVFSGISQTLAFQYNPPPKDISSDCSFEDLSSNTTNTVTLQIELQRRSYCHYLCTMPNCCNIPSGEDGTCIDQHSISCDRYIKYCNVITPIMEKYDAFDDLPLLYDTTFLTSIITKDDNSTTKTTTLEFLTRNKKQCRFKNIKSFDDWALCSDICLQGTCCLSSIFSNSSDSCLHGNEHACLEYYSYCQTVYSTYIHHIKVPPPSENISSICSKDNIQTNPNKCRNACSKAQCCFATKQIDQSTYHDNCQNINNETCHLYASCQNLQSDVGFTTDEIVQEIRQVCTDDISTNIITLFQCYQLCKPVSCCFDDTTKCHRNVDCMKYERCTIAFHHLQATPHDGISGTHDDDLFNDKPIDDKPFNTTLSPTIASTIAPTVAHNTSLSNSDKLFLIEKTCTPTKISTQDGWNACYDLCVERSCCFTFDNDCLKGNEKWCEEFQYCAYVFMKDAESISMSETLLPSSALDESLWFDGNMSFSGL